MITKTPPTTTPSPLTAAAADALRNAKTAFLGANEGRCGYLRVTFAPADGLQAIVVSALFTLPDDREWHNAEARIDARDLRRDPEAAVARAFATLEDGIATVGIAQLFRPRAAADWSAAGRL